MIIIEHSKFILTWKVFKNEFTVKYLRIESLNNS